MREEEEQNKERGVGMEKKLQDYTGPERGGRKEGDDQKNGGLTGEGGRRFDPLENVRVELTEDVRADAQQRRPLRPAPGRRVLLPIGRCQGGIHVLLAPRGGRSRKETAADEGGEAIRQV